MDAIILFGSRARNDARVLYEAYSGSGALKLAELAIHAEEGDVPFKYIQEVIYGKNRNIPSENFPPNGQRANDFA